MEPQLYLPPTHPHPVTCWSFSTHSHSTIVVKAASVLPIMHSACKPHLHLTHCSQCSDPPLPRYPPVTLPEGPVALNALHTQPGTLAAPPPPFPPVWRCEAGLCDALTPVTVSPKCKAVAPSCGQVFSWEFYSGKVPGASVQVHTADGWGYRLS